MKPIKIECTYYYDLRIYIETLIVMHYFNNTLELAGNILSYANDGSASSNFCLVVFKHRVKTVIITYYVINIIILFRLEIIFVF